MVSSDSSDSNDISFKEVRLCRINANHIYAAGSF